MLQSQIKRSWEFFRLEGKGERKINDILKIQACDSKLILLAELRNTGQRISLGGGGEDCKFNSVVGGKNRISKERCHIGAKCRVRLSLDHA